MSFPNIVLREAEVIAHDARAVPPAGTHDGGYVVAANEEVLPRAYARGVPRDFAIAGLCALGFDDGEFHDLADTPPADRPAEDFTPVVSAEDDAGRPLGGTLARRAGVLRSAGSRIRDALGRTGRPYFGG